MRNPQSAASSEIPPSLVRAELERILASEIFARSDRLSAFLTFIVDQTLNGQGDSLKEQVIAAELYGKGADFSTAADPIVRVDARRLRDKLREYYASAPQDALVISMPKGSYTPVFAANGIGVGTDLEITARPPGVRAAGPPDTAARGWSWLGFVAAGVALVGAFVWLVIGSRVRPSDQPPIRLLTVTSFPGAEGMPTLSPDGNFVAFTWTGPVSTDTADIWVKAVDSDALRRLTDTPQWHEALPSWSPDGRQIAFQRAGSDGNDGVHLISPLGGATRRIVAKGAEPSWTPDGRSLIMLGHTAASTAVFEQALEGGTRRQLTEPPPGFSDEFPKVSPDGSRLAFVRTSVNLTQAAVFVMAMSGGEPRRLTEWDRTIGRLDWTPDGRDILYPETKTSGLAVWRIAADGKGPPRGVPGIPPGTNMISVSQFRPGGTFRLALSYGQIDVGLRLVDLQSAGANGVFADVRPFCDATRKDMPGRFSRDGTHVAFTSDRSGVWQVWVADQTGTGLRTVTGLEGAAITVGSWSPDGRSIALDAVVGGASKIYVGGVDGGASTRLTDGPSRDSDPDWSGDGRWIYYASDASGRSEIWKIRVGGGKSMQLTTDGGFEPREAPDGRTVVYTDAPHKNGLAFGATLKQISTDGTAPSVVLSGVPPGAWDVTDTGIVFVTGTAGPSVGHAAADEVQFYSFADRRVRRLGKLPFLIARFGSSRLLSVSRDGHWALVSHIDDWPRDILVADNLR